MFKKIFFAIVAMLSLSVATYASTDAYVLNNDAVEQAFAQASEMSVNDITVAFDNVMTTTSMAGTNAQLKEVNPWAAAAICFIIGEFGIHRHYMGTSKAMWAIYTFTCGGIFGIVPFVDFIVLLVGAIEDNISSYIGNTRFFMWL